MPLSPSQRGICLALTGHFFLSIMSATIKVVQEHGIPATQIMFVDGLVGALAMVVMAAFNKDLKGLKTRNPLQLVLMIVNVATAFLLFHSFAHMPLVNAYVIAYLAPFIIFVLSVFFLKEKTTKGQAGALVAGFAGVILALSPQEMVFNTAVLTMAAGTTLFSVAQILVRKMSASESLWSFPFYFYIGMIVLSGVLFHGEFVTEVQGLDMARLVLIGMLDALTLCLFYGSLKLAKATVVSPFQFSSIIWVTVLDIVFWTKYPPAHTYMGAVIVVLAGIYLMRAANKAK